jgi:HlyD family secretion protein
VAEKLNTLRGDIAIAKANLKSQTTGDKEALIKEAQSRLLYNAKQIEDQKVMVSRVETLKSKGLGSQQEYETQKWLLDLYEIEKGVYQSQLENLKTGVKKEEKDLLATQVTSLETQYRVLQDRFKKLAILAPLSGRLGVVFSPDTLLSVINDKEIVLQTAIQTKDLDLIKAGQNVSIQFAGKDEKIRGEILSISREVKLIHGEQIVFASILLDNSRGRLIPGMVLESFIDIREMSFFEYLVKTLLK